MNYPGTNQPPPSMYAPPKKPFPVVPVILGVLALFVALVVVVGVTIFHAVQENSSEAIPVGDNFINDMGTHDYKAAVSLFTPDVRAKTTASDLKDMEAMVEKHHGTFVAHGQPQWNVQNWNGQTSVRLAYPAQYTTSVSTVTLILVKSGDKYQVYGAHYDF